MNDFDLCLEVV